MCIGTNCVIYNKIQKIIKLKAVYVVANKKP